MICMSDLATLAINAHGGLDRWRRFKTLSAHLLQGGVLWKLKGQDGVLDDVHLTVDLRKEWRRIGHSDSRVDTRPFNPIESPSRRATVKS
jgi:hypothetical protein